MSRCQPEPSTSIPQSLLGLSPPPYFVPPFVPRHATPFLVPSLPQPHRAAAAGINSLFVAGGIHARELIPAAEQQQQVQGVDMEALRRLCRENGRPAPTYALARLVW